MSGWPCRTCAGWALVNWSAVALAGGTLWACEAKAACQCVCAQEKGQ